jgi:hypothetical protein
LVRTVVFLRNSFSLIFFSSLNLKGKFFNFFLHASLVYFVYLFCRLKLLISCSNFCTQKHSKLYFFVPTPRSGSSAKPVCILTCGELCPAKSQYGYSIIILLSTNLFMKNLCYSYHFWIVISYFRCI